jgi:ABC-type polysaccharide/polyol phosphate transport system ATPase subunit
VIAFSELGVFFDAPIKTYSSGMLARLAFSVGTQLKPDILLLDEVLAVGDERFQQKSFFRVKKLIGSGSLVLLVSHSSAMVEAMATRAILLEDGRIVGDGKPSEIIAQYRKQVERK